MTYFSRLVDTLVKFKLWNKVSFIFKTGKVPTKINLLPCANIYFKIYIPPAAEDQQRPPGGPLTVWESLI
jgi:hypothetical protein